MSCVNLETNRNARSKMYPISADAELQVCTGVLQKTISVIVEETSDGRTRLQRASLSGPSDVPSAFPCFSFAPLPRSTSASDDDEIIFESVVETEPIMEEFNQCDALQC